MAPANDTFTARATGMARSALVAGGLVPLCAAHAAAAETAAPAGSATTQVACLAGIGVQRRRCARIPGGDESARTTVAGVTAVASSGAALGETEPSWTTESIAAGRAGVAVL